jgi:hypothetical protein
VSFAASFGHVIIHPAARDNSYGNDTAEQGITIEAVVGAAQLATAPEATAPEATAPEMTFQEDRDQCYEIIVARYRKPGEDLSSTWRESFDPHIKGELHFVNKRALNQIKSLGSSESPHI